MNLSALTMNSFPDSPKSVSHGKHMSDREGVIELSHEYAIEKAHYGNENSKGFSHICVSVDSVRVVCERLSSAGYTSQKHSQGGYAFVQDHDKNWVKLIPQNPVCDTESVTTTDVQGYKMNHTMLRIKDKDASLRFYQDVFCMKLKHTFRNPEAGYDCYFLDYHLPDGRNEIDTPESHADSEGLLVLTWNYETESEDGVVHHNSHSEGEGFGHICISVDDITLACERFDKNGVSWQKRLMDGPFRVAFIVDPSGYVSVNLVAKMAWDVRKAYLFPLTIFNSWSK